MALTPPSSSASLPNRPPDSQCSRRRSRARYALAFCAQPRNLNRTVRIAIVVGIVLTAINQGSVIASGHATTGTWVRCVLNFIVPFLVSNAGLLSADR